MHVHGRPLMSSRVTGVPLWAEQTLSLTNPLPLPPNDQSSSMGVPSWAPGSQASPCELSRLSPSPTLSLSLQTIRARPWASPHELQGHRRPLVSSLRHFRRLSAPCLIQIHHFQQHNHQNKHHSRYVDHQVWHTQGRSNRAATSAYMTKCFSKYLLTAMVSRCSVVEGSFLTGQSRFLQNTVERALPPLLPPLPLSWK